MPFRRAPNCATGPCLPERLCGVPPSLPERLQRRPCSLPEHTILACDRVCHPPDVQRNESNGMGCRLGRRQRAPVGERQPLQQQLRRLVGGLPVKRHHRGRHAGEPFELGAPAVADRGDLDEVQAAANGFFEAMNGHECLLVWSRLILRARRRRSSEARCEGGVHSHEGSIRAGQSRQNKFTCAGCPQDLHAPSTAFPQRLGEAPAEAGVTMTRSGS